MRRLLTVPSLPSEDVVSRTRGAVLGELRALVSLQHDDRRQLAEVERHELLLIARIDRRTKDIDRLLEELTVLHTVEEMEALG